MSKLTMRSTKEHFNESSAVFAQKSTHNRRIECGFWWRKNIQNVESDFINKKIKSLFAHPSLLSPLKRTPIARRSVTTKLSEKKEANKRVSFFFDHTNSTHTPRKHTNRKQKESTKPKTIKSAVIRTPPKEKAASVHTPRKLASAIIRPNNDSSNVKRSNDFAKHRIIIEQNRTNTLEQHRTRTSVKHRLGHASQLNEHTSERSHAYSNKRSHAHPSIEPSTHTAAQHQTNTFANRRSHTLSRPQPAQALIQTGTNINVSSCNSAKQQKQNEIQPI